MAHQNSRNSKHINAIKAHIITPIVSCTLIIILLCYSNYSECFVMLSLPLLLFPDCFGLIFLEPRSIENGFSISGRANLPRPTLRNMLWSTVSPC